MSRQFHVRMVTDRRPEVAALARSALADGLEDVAEDCLTEANRTVPLEEGVLQSSGVAVVDELEWEVTYSTPYAVKQHEDTSLNHDPGRRAKWLALTVQENKQRWEQHLRAVAAARLR